MEKRFQKNAAFFSNANNNLSGDEILVGKGRLLNQRNNNSISDRDGTNSLKMKIKQAKKTGILNVSTSNINGPLPSDVFISSTTIPTISDGNDEKFWEIEPIKTLDVSFNKITSISSEIKEFCDLLTLKARDNLIMKLPEDFYQSCVLIRIIDLSKNKIEEISENIAYLTDLRELLLSENNLSNIPNNMSKNCPNLRNLDLSNNQLGVLPVQWSLQYLTTLNLSHNKLQTLPPTMNQLYSLETLNISCNNISHLPDFSSLIHIKYFDATQNNLTNFPLFSQSHNTLLHLYIGYNHISSIDMEILLPHTNLCELLLHNNNLIEINEKIELLQQCKVLDLSNNDIRDLPASIGYMNNLQHLKVDGNPIKSIRQPLLRKSIQELKTYLRTRGPSILSTQPMLANNNRNNNNNNNLKASSNGHDEVINFRVRDATNGVFDLSKLSLTTLSDEIMEYILSMHYGSSIHTINLSDNNFTSIPLDTLLSFPQLKSIIMKGNKLGNNNNEPFIQFNTSQKYEIFSFDFSFNKITSLLFDIILSNINITNELLINNNLTLQTIPSSINSLMSLKILQLSYCNLTNISIIDFNSLRNLVSLDISNNKIITIENCNLLSCHNDYSIIKLEYLSIENNNISEIPFELGHIQTLKTLLISGNPQKMIRPQIILQGSNKVLEYIRSRIIINDYNNSNNNSNNNNNNNLINTLSSRVNLMNVNSSNSNIPNPPNRNNTIPPSMIQRNDSSVHSNTPSVPSVVQESRLKKRSNVVKLSSYRNPNEWNG
eukprot:gene9430-12706_t